MEIITWLKAHWQDIIALYTAIVAVASIIVKLTPTIKDEGWLLAVVKFVAKYVALNRSVNDNAIRDISPKE